MRKSRKKPNRGDSIPHIHGKVLSDGGSLLAGARVACDGGDTITLFDGTYALAVEPGTYTLTASLKGFKSQSAEVAVGDDTISLDFCLSQATGNSRISGTVYDRETKELLSSGTVILILPIANRYADIIHGSYEFDGLVEDSYRLIVSADGYEDEKATVDVKDGERKIHDFSCRPVMVIEPPWG